MAGFPDRQSRLDSRRQPPNFARTPLPFPVRIFIFLLLLTGLSRAAGMREWTDDQNRRIEATLVEIKGQTVILKLADGREVPYPLASLSAGDAAYVKLVAATMKPDLAPGNAGAKEKPDFSSPWPERAKLAEDPEIATVEEDAKNKRFIYESANYQYVSDVRLSKSVVKGFAVMFEACFQFCRALPLGIDGGFRNGRKNRILLFEKFDDYIEAGGPPSSAGVFMGASGVVIVPLTSLGVRPVGSGYMFDHSKDSGTLCHELTHQLTPENYFQRGCVGWFTEGLAEYISTTPYRGGSFTVRTNQNDIEEYVTAYGIKDRGGRVLGREIKMASLAAFMKQPYSSFTSNGQYNYGCALLISNYFFHMDGDGDAKRIKAYLKAVHEGKDAVASYPILLDGRTFQQLEADIAKAWGSKGVKFIFGK